MRSFSSATTFFYNGGILLWDILLTLLNLVRFKRSVGKVTPAGHPGYGGQWPEYRPPKEGDSRCPCPGLNAMANHGIISRSGRGIKFTELTPQIRTTYNFSATFCSFTTHYAARMLGKSYSKDTFDLHELDLHNGIEHDASLTRLDAAIEPDQSKVHVPFINELLDSASGKDCNGKPLLTIKDMSSISGKRRAQARATNKAFTLDFVHKMFGNINALILLTIFGGRVEDLRPFLLEERLPKGWESRIRQPYGMTMLTVNKTALTMELGTKEPEGQPE